MKSSQEEKWSWDFYQNDSKEWIWRKFSHETGKIVKSLPNTFINEEICKASARINGWNGENAN